MENTVSKKNGKGENEKLSSTNKKHLLIMKSIISILYQTEGTNSSKYGIQTLIP
jgi:hypothetical protein